MLGQGWLGVSRDVGFLSPISFSETEGREKADCPPLSLFVLSNLTYVICQTDRLFGKPDGPRQKSSGFSKCEKLGSGGPGGKVCVCVCVCVVLRVLYVSVVRLRKKLLHDIQAFPSFFFLQVLYDWNLNKKTTVFLLVAGSAERLNWPRMGICQGYNRAAADSFLSFSSSCLQQNQWVSKRHRNLHLLFLRCHPQMITAVVEVRH